MVFAEEKVDVAEPSPPKTSFHTAAEPF